ncbi:MAG TPA: spore coat U domain-containing protein [Steroidobacteraceae bacterium]|nr:spore coat U domain-containing protein [Steroidobacteraceae bacterium]
MRNFIACLSAGVLLASAGAAQAATATNTFTVTATVVKNCTVGATNIVFANYTPGSGVSPAANSTVSVSCTKSTAFTVALNKGTTTGGSIAQRLMTDGAAGDTLQYNLYTTAAFTTVWGDGTGSSVTQPGTGTGMATPVTFTAFGQVPDNATNQAAPPNTYTDTITVTVTY